MHIVNGDKLLICIQTKLIIIKNNKIIVSLSKFYMDLESLKKDELILRPEKQMNNVPAWKKAHLILLA